MTYVQSKSQSLFIQHNIHAQSKSKSLCLQHNTLNQSPDPFAYGTTRSIKIPIPLPAAQHTCVLNQNPNPFAYSTIHSIKIPILCLQHNMLNQDPNLLPTAQHTCSIKVPILCLQHNTLNQNPNPLSTAQHTRSIKIPIPLHTAQHTCMLN